jgi:NAD+ kinase
VLKNAAKDMKIVLFGSGKPDAYCQITDLLSNFQDVEVIDEASYWPDAGVEEPKPPFPEADMAFSIGGDGTFLRTAHRVGRSGLPILGINAGRLGFLSDMQLNEIALALPGIIQGDFEVEHRSLLRLELTDFKDPYQVYSLNDVAVLKCDLSSMVSVSVRVDGEFLNRYDADGLVVATPTGSTAYAMSAGGPILEPQSHCLTIVPIAPHSLTARPMVIHDNCVLDISVDSRNGRYLVATDGAPLHLTTETRLRLRLADYRVSVVRRPCSSFYETLRHKLMWGKDPR